MLLWFQDADHYIPRPSVEMGLMDINNKGNSIVVLVVVAATIIIDCGSAWVTQRGPVTLAISDKDGLIYRIGLGSNVISSFCFN